MSPVSNTSLTMMSALVRGPAAPSRSTCEAKWSDGGGVLEWDVLQWVGLGWRVCGGLGWVSVVSDCVGLGEQGCDRIRYEGAAAEARRGGGVIRGCSVGCLAGSFEEHA